MKLNIVRNKNIKYYSHNNRTDLLSASSSTYTLMTEACIIHKANRTFVCECGITLYVS